MCGFDRDQRGNYFRGKPIRRIEVEVRVEKLNPFIAADSKPKLTIF